MQQSSAYARIRILMEKLCGKKLNDDQLVTEIGNLKARVEKKTSFKQPFNKPATSKPQMTEALKQEKKQGREKRLQAMADFFKNKKRN